MKHRTGIDICSNCGSVEEVVFDAIIKCDHYYDMREGAVSCGVCGWGKSRTITYVDESLQELAERPFRRYGKECKCFIDKRMDDFIITKFLES